MVDDCYIKSEVAKNSSKKHDSKSEELWSLSSIVDTPLPTDEMLKNNSNVVDETPAMDSDNATGLVTSVSENIGKFKVDEPVVRHIT